jgi:dTDP-4-dehydrorhamnose reductase
MPKQRLLITGGSGLLALNWACATRQTYDVILATHRHTVHLNGTTAYSLDLGAPETVCRQLDTLSPDLVIHTAALTNVDRCETDKDLAFQSNVVIAEAVAAATAANKIPFVHISTDHLFAGTRRLYSEDNEPEPLNEYARTKALAETRVRQTNPSALIVRTNFFCWGHKQRQSFSDWIINSLRGSRTITLFDDVFFTPILADPLVLAILEVVGIGVSGVIHIGGDERLSKYEFGVRLAERFGLSLDLIQRGTIAAMDAQITRPRDMSLDNEKARCFLGRPLGTVDQYLADLQAQERGGRRSELAQAVV